MAMVMMRSRIGLRPSSASRIMDASRKAAARYFADGKGKVLSEEERAAENIYIQKMERERLEKLRQKAEKEKAASEKEQADKKNEGETKG